MQNRTEILAQGLTVEDTEVTNELKTAFYYSHTYTEWDTFIKNTYSVCDGVITYMDGTAEIAKMPGTSHAENKSNSGSWTKENYPRHAKGSQATNKPKPGHKNSLMNYNTGRYERKRQFSAAGECVPFLPRTHGARIEFRARVDRGMPVMEAFEITLKQFGGCK